MPKSGIEIAPFHLIGGHMKLITVAASVALTFLTACNGFQTNQTVDSLEETTRNLELASLEVAPEQAEKMPEQVDVTPVPRVIRNSPVGVSPEMPIDRQAAETIVKKAYQAILQRDPEPAGLKYYSDLLIMKTLDEAGLTQELIASDEYFVVTVYLKELKRLPETAGRKYHTDLLKQGYSRATVAAAIANSDEAFVRSLFLKHLYREVEKAGLEYYVKQLSSGRSRSAVESEIANSPEGTVHAVYRALLDRAPEKVGLDYWMAELSSGRLNRAGFEASVKASNEYFVRSAWKKYHSILHPQ